MTNRSAILFFLLLLVACKYDSLPPPQIYLEGKPIPGTEMHFPQNVNVDKYLYGGDALLPKVSPDSTKLLYTGNIHLGSKGLWVMDLATLQKTLITDFGIDADWGPDSQSIYFSGQGQQIYKTNLGNSTFKQLTFSGGDLYPNCSSDGNFILYNKSLCSEPDSCGVYIMTSEGAENKYVQFVSLPIWLPNQQAFLASNGKIYDTTGAELRNLNLNLKTGIVCASISKFDDRIVISTINGIYITNSDGSLLKRILPNHLYNNYYNGPIKLWAQNASWHPDGKHIVYEHLAIDESVQTNDGLYIKGTMSFYKVNADSAIMVSNLELNDN